MANIKFCTSTCSVVVNGVPYSLLAGQAWVADDPVVLAHPKLFTDLPTWVYTINGPVEQATAAPGEKRNVRRPA